MADESVTVEIDGTTRGLQRALATARGRLRQFGQSAVRVIRAASGPALATFAAIFGVLGGAAAIINSVTSRLDAMGKSAARAAEGAEAMQAIALAADRSDVAIGAVEKAMRRTADIVQQFSAGTASAEIAETFERLGVDPAVIGRIESTGEALEFLLEAINRLPTAVERAAAAQQLGLGRVLNLEGIAEAREQLEALGAVIPAQMIANSEQFRDNLGDLGKLTTTFADAVIGSLVPALDKAFIEILGGSIADILAKEGDLIGFAERVAVGMVNAFNSAFGTLVTLFNRIETVMAIIEASPILRSAIGLGQLAGGALGRALDVAGGALGTGGEARGGPIDPNDIGRNTERSVGLLESIADSMDEIKRRPAEQPLAVAAP